MIVKASVKVVLSDEEKDVLKQAMDVIDSIYIDTRDCNCEIEFEDDDVYDILDDMQSQIRNII